MTHWTPIWKDPQRERAAAECTLCSMELYDADALYAINGATVCEGCLEDYAREAFRSFRMSGAEWRSP
jgi:formylmethanofuran dehydrogenase subunit E